MNYYKRLEKEERLKVKGDFLKSDNSLIYKKANKIFIISIIGLFIAVCAGLFDIVYKTGTINYVLDGLLFIFSLIFLIKMNSTKNIELNKYALDYKKNKEDMSKRKKMDNKKK